jgi:hypothetical protein
VFQEHGPEKVDAGFPKKSCSNQKKERDHRAPGCGMSLRRGTLRSPAAFSREIVVISREVLMKTLIIAAVSVAATLVFAPLATAGNTSSNSSSNTSSDSGSHGSSYRHSHSWSIDSDDGRRRRVIRGSTHIDRYVPRYDRSYRARRFDRDDD